MRLPDLRHRLFLALGLPLSLSCGGPQPGPGPGGGDGLVTGGGGDTTVLFNTVEDAPPGAPCGVDQIREVVCGATTPGTCGATGDSLTSYGQSSLHVTQGSYGAHDATFADFALDPDRTAAYQHSLAGQGLNVDEYCCYTRCTPLRVATTAALDVPLDHTVSQQCIPAPEGGTRAPADGDPGCPGAVELGGELRPHAGARGEGQCCYSVAVYEPPERHYRGRAARVDGEVVVAEVAAGQGWRAEAAAPDVAALAPAVRARLAAAWAVTAQMEHASIASFSNLSLWLLALGAPVELIAATHRAALDEVEHARVAFALASAYGGAPVAPAPFPAAARLSAAGGLEALAVETLRDGCIGETVAAVEAGVAAGRAADPAVAAALARIAEDETRHAELAWQIVAWCVRAEPAVAAAVRGALAAELAASTKVGPADDPPEVAAHGVVGPAELAGLRRAVLRDVVRPLADAVLAPA